MWVWKLTASFRRFRFRPRSEEWAAMSFRNAGVWHAVMHTLQCPRVVWHTIRVAESSRQLHVPKGIGALTIRVMYICGARVFISGEAFSRVTCRCSAFFNDTWVPWFGERVLNREISRTASLSSFPRNGYDEKLVRITIRWIYLSRS
jgi:hypothetical protein